VRRPDHPAHWIMQQDRLAVGLLDEQPHAGLVGDERVMVGDLAVFPAGVNDRNPAAVDLDRGHEAAYTQALLDPLPVRSNVFRMVTHPVAEVEACMGLRADAAVAAEHPVGKIKQRRAVKLQPVRAVDGGWCTHGITGGYAAPAPGKVVLSRCVRGRKGEGIKSRRPG
jgi:hypothetical protein